MSSLPSVQNLPSVAIVQCGRLASTRVPDKLLQEVNGISLIDRAFEYMLNISQLRPNIKPIFICPQSDKILMESAEAYGIFYIGLTEDDAKGRQWTDLIQPSYCMDILQQYDWIWDANIACHPFLTIKTGLNIIDDCQGFETQRGIYPKGLPRVYVLEQRDIIWNNKGLCINGTEQLADTKNNPVCYRPSHIAHCYSRSWLRASEAHIANNLFPIPLSLSKMEQLDIDTEEDMDIARRLASKEQPLPSILDAIAIGTGPSFYDWIKEPVLTYYSTKDGTDTKPKSWSPKLYGCGVSPLYINNLSYYLYGDSTHVNNIPDPDSQFHPGCITYAGTRNLNDKRTDGANTPRLLPYADLDLPHGESSGGMALSLACLHSNVVGLIGFDGHRDGFVGTSDEDYSNFLFKTRQLINYWQNRGRRLVSLMPDSVFNPILEPAIKPIRGKSTTV